MSSSPASKACTAVVPSEIIRPLIRSSETSSALRQSFHFTRSSRELCCQASSLNGPFVTMFAASVHLFPNFSTVGRCTAMKEWWATCWMNQGCGVVSFTSSVCLSVAVTPTLSRSAAQSFLQLL